MASLADLIENKNILAVYAYTSMDKTIPFVIAEKGIDWTNLRDQADWTQGGILLTRQDMEQGKDAFALQFLHMQAHTELVAGEDILAATTIAPKDTRLAFEKMLRVTMIDMREILVSEDTYNGKQLALTLHRILENLDLIDHNHVFADRLESMIATCTDRSLSGIDVEEIYTLVAELTQYVDTMN